MSKFKKIILIVTVILLVLVIVFLFVSPKPKNISNLEGHLPTPNIPQYINGKYQIESQLKASDFNFPSSLPILTLRPHIPYTINDAKKIANSLGFSNEPTVINDVFDGQTFYWNTSDYSLVIYSKSRKTVYANLQNTVSVNSLDKQQAIDLATNFLVQKGFFAKDQIKFSFFKVLPEDRSYEIDFTYSLINYPVITIIPDTSPINIVVSNVGKVRTVNVSNLGDLSKSSDYNLKNFQQVVSSLSSAKVVRLDNGEITLQELTDSPIQKIVVSKAELGYLFNAPADPNISPVYILSGQATLIQGNRQVEVVLYLPAIQGN